MVVLPAGACRQQLPGLTVNLNLPGNRPISRRWLGENKTWAAWYAAAVGAVVTIYLQWLFPRINETIGLFDYGRSDLWLVGLLFGLGAVAGDQAKSFVKRRIGIRPGERWWPFDQLDFVAGSLLFLLPIVGGIGWRRVLAIVVVELLGHPLWNTASYRLGLRRTPW